MTGNRLELMCGIVGYVGSRGSVDVLIGGLKRLEYRGYDSAGVAVIDGHGHLGTRKHAGKLGVLTDDLSAILRDAMPPGQPMH